MKRTVHQKIGKRLLLSFTAILALTAYNAKAQSPTIYLGATVGGQYTSINSDDEKFNAGVGYNAEISAEARFSRQFGIELQYGISAVNTNTTYKDSIKYYDYVARYNNNYSFATQWLQGQLLFKYYIRLGGDPIIPYDRPQGSGNYVYFFAGPYVGNMLSSSITHWGRTGSQSVQLHTNNTPYDSGAKTSTTLTGGAAQEAIDKSVLTNLDYGYCVGAGLSLRLSQAASLDFTLRYNGGLTSLDNTTLTATTQSGDGFFLGHMNITFTGTNATAITYTAAQAFTSIIALNVGLKFKLFGDSY